jgi:hypothetical protein
MPSTPAGDKFHSTVFGLLTPSTPGFGGFAAYTPATPIYHDEGRESDSTIDAGDSTIPARIPPSRSARALRERPQRRQAATASINEDTASEDDEPLSTQYEKLQDQIRLAELTAKFAEQAEYGRARRSTRLAGKEVVKGMLCCHRFRIAC